MHALTAAEWKKKNIFFVKVVGCCHGLMQKKKCKNIHLLFIRGSPKPRIQQEQHDAPAIAASCTAPCSPSPEGKSE